MRIEEYYTNFDKGNFYLGMISQVYKNNSYVQVENLSLLSHRKIHSEILVPNTINYFVIIENVRGLFLGEVYQSKIPSSGSVHDAMKLKLEEKIYPEISLDIVGMLSNEKKKFEFSGFKTVGIGDKVYVANDKVIDIYLKSIEINSYMKNINGERVFQKKLNDFARLPNLRDEKIDIYPNTIFDRHFLIVGTTNSGKSTSALSILDKLCLSKRKILLIDPTGEYENSFSINEMKKLTLGVDTVLKIGSISMSQWELLFQTNGNTQGAVLAEAIKSLRYQYKKCINSVYIKDGKDAKTVKDDMSSVEVDDVEFNLELLPEQINQESVKLGTNQTNKDKYLYDQFTANTNEWLVQKIKYEFDHTNITNFFSSKGQYNLMTQIDAFLGSTNRSIYINASKIGTTDGIGAMIIDLLSNYLVNKDVKDINPFVMFIDEVHRYTDSNINNSGLISIGREGRKKGIFLFLTTQSPKDIPEILLGQIGTLLVHRLTDNDELKMIQNYLDDNTLKQVRKLNQGEAILTSINLLKDINVNFNKTKRVHNNSTPIL